MAVKISSAFQPYVVDIQGLNASEDVSWKGVPRLIWWGGGFVTLEGRIKVAVQYATKAGEQISWDEHIIELGQTRTFSNPSGQDMSVYLLETVSAEVYTCPHCGATFGSQAELDVHIASEHPAEPPPPTPPTPPEGRIIGVDIDRGRDGITWSPDERHLGYNELSEAGFNTLCSLWCGREWVSEVHSYGFKVIGLAGAGSFESVYEQADWRTAEGCDYIWLDELIANRNFTESQYNQIRNHCHSINPNVRVLICEVHPSTLERVKNWPNCDGIMVQQYPHVWGGPESRIPWLENYKSTYPNQTVLAWIAMEKTMEGVSAGQTRNDTIRHLNCAIDGIVHFIFRTRSECFWEEAKQAVKDVTGGGPTISPPPTYTCPECGATFASQAELDSHIATAHPPPVYECPHCGLTFGTQAELDLHVASEHPPLVYTCPECGATFASQAELDSHIAAVHPPAVFTCPHCGEVFSTQAELDSHIASEHPIFTCSYCGATFISQAELDAHIATEHPPLVYTCPECGEVFGSQAELDSHIAAVHPPPVYECPHCGLTFTTEAELDAHVASEHPAASVFKCTYCGAIFASQADLNTHIATAHPVAAEIVPWYKHWQTYLLLGGVGALITGVVIKKRKKK